MTTTDELLKKIRMHRTKANDQAWVEQAAAWRLAQEQAMAKDSDKNTPTTPKT